MKATWECEEIKCTASLHVFLQKKIVSKAKYKDEDTVCKSVLRVKEHGENANMVEVNIEIKVEKEFPAAISIVKEIEGDKRIELRYMR